MFVWSFHLYSLDFCSYPTILFPLHPIQTKKELTHECATILCTLTLWLCWWWWWRCHIILIKKDVVSLRYYCGMWKEKKSACVLCTLCSQHRCRMYRNKKKRRAFIFLIAYFLLYSYIVAVGMITMRMFTEMHY